MKILLIENNEKLIAKLSRLLNRNHFESYSSYDAEAGLDEALSEIYDAIILDTESPGCGGLEVLKQIRRAGLSVPVLLLSPKCGVIEKVRGLDSGADDFLEKPFADAELIARLCAISRRKGELIQDNQIFFAQLSLNLNTYQMTIAGNSVRLSNPEFEIMKYFILHGCNVIGKEELLTKLWGFESSPAENNLEVYITYLRRKLKLLHSGVRIHCIKNVGYHLMNTEE